MGGARYAMQDSFRKAKNPKDSYACISLAKWYNALYCKQYTIARRAKRPDEGLVCEDRK